jgi:hypothetical protein
MKTLLIAMGLLGATSTAHAETCADTVPKGGEYVYAPPDDILEGGRRCYVRHKDGGDRIVHTIVWDTPILENKNPDKKDDKKKPPKQPEPPKPCEPTQAQLVDMWRVNNENRKASKSKLQPSLKTFGIAIVLDEKCKEVTRAHGEFVGDKHAEQLIIEKLAPATEQGKKIKPGYWTWWLIDQVPCAAPVQDGKDPVVDPNKPADGYCTDNLPRFATERKVGMHVYAVAAKLKKADKHGNTHSSPKQFAVRGTTPTGDNFIELTEFARAPTP